MIEGLLLILLTGLIWFGNGIIFSYAARKALDFVAIMMISTFWGMVLSWLFISKPQMILNGTASRFGELAIIMIASGVIGTIGVVVMQKAMRIGHHGVVWTISQFALIVPFLFGIMIFHEPTTTMKNAGISCVVISFLAFGLGQSGSQQSTNRSFHIWFPTTLLAFGILGIHQSLTLIPSCWPNWQDTANLRGALINSGFFIAYFTATIASGRRPNRLTLKLGLLSGVLVFISPLTLFGSMDYLQKANMLSLVYPLAVGTCIIAFMIYSALFLKEKTSIITVAGIIAGIAGLMLIAI